MEWLNNLIKKNPLTSLLIPTFLSGLSFFGSIIDSLRDGDIDNVEFHQILSSANGLETLLLIIIMIALKVKKK